MKPILTLFLVTLFIFSCKTKEKLKEFDVDYSTILPVPSASIAVNSPTTSVEFTTPTVATEQSSKFSSAGTSQKLIDQIKMTRFNVSAVESGTNLDFLKSMSVYIKAANVGEQLIASKTSFQTGVTSEALDLKDVNIKDYIFSG